MNLFIVVILLFTAIHRIVAVKLPEKELYYYNIVDKFQLFQLVVHGIIIDLYNPQTQEFKTYNKFDFLKYEEFEEAIREVNNYFVQIIYDEDDFFTLNDGTKRPVLSQFPTVDIVGSSFVWDETKNLHEFMNANYDEEVKLALKSGIPTAEYQSNIITMLRHLEAKKAKEKFQLNLDDTLNLRKGLDMNQMLVVERREYEENKPALYIKQVPKRKYGLPVYNKPT